MNKKILILGGARSGKSGHAVSVAKGGKRVAFIATCGPRDTEMRERIRRHKSCRPRGWKVIEEETDIAGAINRLRGKDYLIIIDCMALWVSNLLAAGLTDAAIQKRVSALRKAVKGFEGALLIVSNEVGEGVVPANRLARRFRDLLGRTNQALAGTSDEVTLMHASIPVKIKG